MHYIDSLKIKFWYKLIDSLTDTDNKDQYLAISSLCAVQSLMYSSCSFMRFLTPSPPGAVTPPQPGLAVLLSLELRCGTRWWGRTWERAPCFGEFRLEPNSSSEVEPYSGGRRLHLLLLDTVKVTERQWNQLDNVTALYSITTFVIHKVNKWACEHERLCYRGSQQLMDQTKL